MTGVNGTLFVSGFGRLDAEGAVEPPIRQIIEVLEQVMCKHDAEKLAIAVLEIRDASKP